jgi:NAD(P)-dependent dehydrogenase (short-subunit alcohol dehydrogenase family)
MDLKQTGRVAFVTGSGRGVGRQIALTFADAGAHVVVNDFFEDRAASVAEEIRERGGRALACQGDVTDQEQVGAVVKKAEAEFGCIDILVHNAGIMPPEAVAGVPAFLFGDTTRKDWDATIDINVFGTLNCAHAVIKGMMERNYGKIVSIMSDAGRVGEAGFVPYSMAKSSMAGFTKALAKEVARYRINVNAVAIGATPGPSIDSWLGATPEEKQKKIEALIRVYPMGKGLKRLGLPSDVANAVAFLCSDVSEWITGQILSVNGGYTMVG